MNLNITQDTTSATHTKTTHTTHTTHIEHTITTNHIKNTNIRYTKLQQYSTQKIQQS